MATEADTISMEPEVVDYYTTAALTGGQVIQLPSGRAGVVLRDKAATVPRLRRRSPRRGSSASTRRRALSCWLAVACSGTTRRTTPRTAGQRPGLLSRHVFLPGRRGVDRHRGPGELNVQRVTEIDLLRTRLCPLPRARRRRGVRAACCLRQRSRAVADRDERGAVC